MELSQRQKEAHASFEEEYTADEQMKDLAIVTIKDAFRFARHANLSLDELAETIQDVMTVQGVKTLKSKL